MRRLERKNNKLNNALGGLASGIQAGIGLGMQARAMRSREESAAFEREQAVLKAKQVADEMAREEAGRAAVGEAASELASPQPKIQFSNDMRFGPMAAAAQGSVALDESAKRVQTIAQEMGKRGVPLKQITEFVEAAKEKHKAIKDQDARKTLTDQISQALQDGTLMGTNLDGSKTDNEAVNKSLQNLMEMVANPDVPSEAIRTQFNALRMQTRQSNTRFKARQRRLEGMDAKIAEVRQQQTAVPGPITPEQDMANNAQLDMLQATRDQFEMFGDEIAKDPVLARELADRWDRFSRGIAGKNPRTGREYTFAEANAVQESEMEIARLTEELKRAQVQKAQTDAGMAGPLANARINSLNRGPAQRPLPPDINYEAARKQAANELSLDPAFMRLPSDEQTKAIKGRADEIVDDARTTMGGYREDKDVLGRKPGATPKSREEEYFADPSKFGSWTDEQIEKWIKTGETP